MKQVFSNRRVITRAFVVTALLVIGLLVVARSSFFKPVSASNRAPLVSINAKTSASLSIKAAGRGTARMNLTDGRALPTTFQAPGNLSGVLQEGVAQPRALASADFDQDGTADLVIGYRTPGGGVLAFQRGYSGALSPRNDEEWEGMKHGQFPAPFLPTAQAIDLPEAADFLITGDFDRDSRPDVVIGALGSAALYFIAGGSQGNFAPAEQISLPGSLTALAGGDVNRADGAADVLVGLAGGQLLIFESPENAFASTPATYQLNGAARAIAVGVVDKDNFIDVAVATGSAVTVIHGADPTQSLPNAIERIDVGSDVGQVAIGEFIWDREGKTEIAAMTGDGTVHLFSQGVLDRRQYSQGELLEKMENRFREMHPGQEMPQNARTRLAKNYQELGYAKTVPAASSSAQGNEAGARWIDAEDLSASGSSKTASSAGTQKSDSPQLMLNTHLSGGSMPDLLVVDPSSGKLRVLFGQTERYPGEKGKAYADKGAPEMAGPRSLGVVRSTPVTIDVTGAPVAVLPLRINVGTRDGLMVLTQGQLNASAVFAPAAITLDVDRFDDNIAITACTAAANDCTLRGALRRTNLSAGADQINLPIGTCNLTLGPGDDTAAAGEDETKGDLDQAGSFLGYTDDNDLTLMGAALSGGVPQSIINIALVGGPYPPCGAGCNPQVNEDRVLDVDGYIGGGSLSTTVTNVRMQNGKATGVNGATDGGGAIEYYGYDFPSVTTHGTLTLNSSVMASNTAPGGSIAGSGGALGGAISVVAGGSLILTNSTISNNTSIISNATATIATGGGITFDGHADGAAHITVTNTTFSGNQVLKGPNGVDLKGGGLFITGIAPGQSGIIQTTSAFTSNTADQDGGGLYLNPNAGPITVTGTTFTTNNAKRNGGGIFNDSRDSGVGIGINHTLTSCTFNANHADSDNNNTGDGGAIFHDRGNLIINTSTIGQSGQANTAFRGAGLAHRFLGGSGAAGNISDITVNGNSIGFNTANSDGGGIYFDSVGQAGGGHSILTLASAVSITSNTAKGNGGGIAVGDLVSAASNMTINTLTIGSNTSNSDSTGGGDGGGLYVNSGLGPVNLASTTIDQNVTNATGTGDGVKLAGGLISCSGTINFNSGDSLDIAGGTFTATSGTTNFTGDFTRSAGTFTHNGGTVNFNGTVTQNINGAAATETFNNFIVNKTGALNTTKTTITTNDLTMTAGTFNAPTNLDINGNALLSAGALVASTSITAAGNWTNNGGTFTPGAGTVTFDGATNQAINGSVNPQTFNNFTVNKSANTLSTSGSVNSLIVNNLTMTLGTFTAPATLDINGNTLLTAGTLTAGTNITAAGDWTNNGGTFTPGANTVTFDGSGAQLLNGSAATQTFNNFVVNKSNLALTGAGSLATLTLNGSMTLTAGTFAAGTITNIGLPGNWTNNGGTFTPGTSTVTFNGGAVQLINGTAASQTFNNVTVNKSANTLSTGGSTVSLQTNNLTMTLGTFTAPATLDINGNTLLTAGTLTAGANITAAGDWTNDGGTFTPGSNTVTFDGAGAQQLKGTAATQTFFNFVVNKGNTLTAAGSLATLNISSNLTITTGTFATGATLLTINVAGNWANTGTFTPGASNTVVFNGTGAGTQTMTGTTSFTNLTLNHTGGGGLTSTGTLTVTGLMRVQAGTFTTSSTFNNVQIDSGATLASDGSTMNVSGNWTNNGGTFTPNGNTVNFTGSAVQLINGTAASQTFNNFTVSKTGGSLSAGGSTTSLTVNNLTMTTGAFNAPATLDINGNALLTAGVFTAGANITEAGNWTNNGATFAANAGTVTFDGSAAQAIGGSAVTTFNKLTISNAGAGVSLTQNETANGTLTLNNDLNTGANTLTQPSSALASAGTADVVGNVKRTGAPLPAGANLTFGNPNNVVNFAGGGTIPTDVTFNMVKSRPTGAGFGFPSAVDRTYTITQNGGAGFSATLQLHYLDSELNGNVEGATLNLWRFNGTAWVPIGQTANDTVNNWVSKNPVTAFSSWAFNSTLTPTASNGVLSGRIVDSNGLPVAGAVLDLSGSQSRKTITDSNGYYRFAEIDTNGVYTVTPARANYNFSPASRSFSQLGNVTEAAFTGAMMGDNLNPVDTPEYFVRQQYVDILGREPDEAGFNYWSDRILACNGDVDCTRAQRTGVASAFFIESEFKQSGAFIYNVYQSSLGRQPVYSEYSTDRRNVVGGPTLEAQKQAFAAAFVARAEFVSRYESSPTAASFVDALLANLQASGVDLSSQRDSLVGRYNAGASQIESRAFVLRDVTESAAVRDANYNASFVAVEYFGYLHRTPERAGFDFWLNVLNTGDPGNYRGMVCSFITSAEYQRRFSNVVSHSNSECGQ